MINFYDENYISKLNRQKRSCLAVYFIVAIFLTLVIVSAIVLNSILPYNFGHRPILLSIVIVATIVLVIFSFIYLQICYRKVADYTNFVIDLSSRRSVTITATIIRVNAQVVSGVIDYYSVDVLEWSNVENDYVERSVFVDAEINNLEFNKDEIVTFVTASNYLIAYKKGV